MGNQWAIADTRTAEVGIVDARPGGEAKIHAGYAERKACFFSTACEKLQPGF